MALRALVFDGSRIVHGGLSSSACRIRGHSVGSSHNNMKPRITVITLGVSDLPRSIRFYRDGLGFPTSAEDDASFAIFMTGGVRLALYPKKALASDISSKLRCAQAGFGGIALGHNVEKKQEVQKVLALAKKAGAKIVKPAQDTFWGGYSGYFADPDGYFWEVAWAPMCGFDDTGALVFKDDADV
jgi:catechol 2,3-dioxygenase-like lactoylglutathione lyase family enzyme